MQHSRRTTLIVITILVGALRMQSGVQADSPNDEIGRTLTGTVRHVDGTPIESFEIRMFVRDDTGSRAQRGGLWQIKHDLGKFRIDGVPEGKLEVEVSAQGYGRAAEVVGPSDRASCRGVGIWLELTAAVHGTVVDAESGEPISDAWVCMRGRLDMVNDVMDLDWQRCESDGTFRFDDLPSGRWQMWTYHEDRPSARASVTLKDGETRERFLRVDRGGAVQGIALDETGAPLAGAYVTARGAGGETTGADGSFHLRGLPFGKVCVRLRPAREDNRYPTHEATWVGVVDVRGGEPSRVELLRVPAGDVKLTGCVRMAGEPVRGRHLLVRDIKPTSLTGLFDDFVIEHPEWRDLRARTDDDGRYSLEGVPSGSLMIGVVLDESSSDGIRWTKIDVPAGESVTRDIDLPDWHIQGTVVRATDGSPVQGGLVTAERELPTRPLLYSRSTSTLTDENGEYSLLLPTPGPHSVIAQGRRSLYGAPAQAVGNDVVMQARDGIHGDDTSPTRVDFALEAGGAARIRVEGMGSAGFGGYVSLVCADRGRDSSTRSSKFIEDRTVVFTNLEPGKYFATAAPGGTGSSVCKVEVRPGEVAEGSITIEPGVDVRFRTLDSNGESVTPRLTISAVPGGGPEINCYRRAYLLEGRYRAVVVADGFRRLEQEFIVRRTDSLQQVEFRLVPE